MWSCANGMAGFGAVFHSIVSGVFAASAGVAGKLAFDETLIANGCLEIQSVLKLSEVLNWSGAAQFLPEVFIHTDVCNPKVRF